MIPFLKRRPKEPREMGPAEVYRRAVDSVALLEGTTEDGAAVRGTGFLVGPGLILTCYHVVRGAKAFRATFPRRDGPGDAIACREYYTSEMKSPCTPVAADSAKDLALLCVEGVDREPLRLAARRAAIGDALVLVGCGDKLLWSMGQASVQQYGRVVHEFKGGLKIDVDVVVASPGTAGGDSGSPVLNLRGEVAGVHSASCPRSAWSTSAAEAAAFLSTARERGVA